MAQPDAQTLVRDPVFQNLPWDKRHSRLKAVDPEYAALPASEQAEVLNGLKTKPFWQGNRSDAQTLVRDPAFQNLSWNKRHARLKEVDPEYAALPASEQAEVLNGLKTKPFWKGGATAKAKKVPGWVKPTLKALEAKKNLDEWTFGAIKNIPGDVVDLAKGTINTLAHPQEAGRAVGTALTGLGMTGYSKLTGTPMNKLATPQEQKEMGEAVKGIRQAVTHPLDVIQKHPVQSALAVSGGLSTASKLANLAKAPRLANTLATTAEAINPVSMATKAISKLPVRPRIKSTLDADMAAREALGKEAGVKLTPADITQRRSTQILESQLDKNIGSANTAALERSAKLKQVGEYVESLQEKMGGKSDKLTAGQFAKTGASDRYEKFMTKASEKYDAIPVEPAEPIETSSLATTASEHLDSLGKIENSTVKGILSKLKIGEHAVPEKISTILDSSGKPVVTEPAGVKPAYTWQELRKDRSSLLKLARTTSDRVKKSIYYDLASAMNDDIATFADKVGNPKIKSALDKANKFYKEGGEGIPGVKTWRDKQIASMLRTESPEDIVGKFFTARPNESDLIRLKSVTGPEGFKELKKAWFDQLISQGEDRSFGLAKFATSYDRFKRSGNLKIILNGAERKGLDKLYKISRIVQEAERVAGNPSGTAQYAINSAYNWVRHPVLMAATQLGSGRLAALYFENPTFRKYLTHGLEFNPLSTKAKLYASRLNKIIASAMSVEAAKRAAQPEAPPAPTPEAPPEEAPNAGSE